VRIRTAARSHAGSARRPGRGGETPGDATAEASNSAERPGLRRGVGPGPPDARARSLPSVREFAEDMVTGGAAGMTDAERSAPYLEYHPSVLAQHLPAEVLDTRENRPISPHIDEPQERCGRTGGPGQGERRDQGVLRCHVALLRNKRARRGKGRPIDVGRGLCSFNSVLSCWPRVASTGADGHGIPDAAAGGAVAVYFGSRLPAGTRAR
jgi:hypothetical protein